MAKKKATKSAKNKAPKKNKFKARGRRLSLQSVPRAFVHLRFAATPFGHDPEISEHKSGPFETRVMAELFAVGAIQKDGVISAEIRGERVIEDVVLSKVPSGHKLGGTEVETVFHFPVSEKRKPKRKQKK